MKYFYNSFVEWRYNGYRAGFVAILKLELIKRFCKLVYGLCIFWFIDALIVSK